MAVGVEVGCTEEEQAETMRRSVMQAVRFVA
jgi:hypothetical protein